MTMFTTIQGNRVRSERARGLDALAKKAGTSRECVSKLEAGVYDFTVGTLQRVATALGAQRMDLLE
jgi:predicted transcriptional regulator